MPAAQHCAALTNKCEEIKPHCLCRRKLELKMYVVEGSTPYRDDRWLLSTHDGQSKHFPEDKNKKGSNHGWLQLQPNIRIH
jgi:hypothetical protein